MNTSFIEELLRVAEQCVPRDEGIPVLRAKLESIKGQPDRPGRKRGSKTAAAAMYSGATISAILRPPCLEAFLRKKCMKCFY